MNAKTQLETDFKNWLTAVSRENIPQNIAAWLFELCKAAAAFARIGSSFCTAAV